MKYNYIYSECNLKENLQELKDMGYQYIVKAQDKFLSGWGSSRNSKHIQLIACYDTYEKEIVLRDLYSDDFMNYVNWYKIDDYKGIYNATYNKTFTIRNDWSRATGYKIRY